jgi:hypothetical protein
MNGENSQGALRMSEQASKFLEGVVALTSQPATGDALKLGGGIFIDYGCTKLTPITGTGVFIRFNPDGGQAMRDLNEFLVKHRYCEPGEGVPGDILDRDPWDIIEAHNLLERMIRDNGGVCSQELVERFHARCRHEGRKSQQTGQDI